MKASIKLAVIGALALVGGVANAANINSSTFDANGSSLLLLLKNSVDNEYLAFELAPKVTDVKSTASLLADPLTQYTTDCPSGTCAPGALTVPAALNGYTNANLTAYLASAENQADVGSITWTIMGGKTLTGGDVNAGNIFVETSAENAFDAYWVGATTKTSAQAVNDMIFEINSSTVVNGQSTTAGFGSSGVIGSQAPGSFGGPNGTGALLGGAQSLYVMSFPGDSGTAANTYKSQYTLTLSSAGVLSYNAPVSAVPVPAAIWLLGSGLMGLVGIGRRRNGTAVAA